MKILNFHCLSFQTTIYYSPTEFLHNTSAVVTPLHKAASYEPRIAILGSWGDTWLTRGKYGIYVVVTESTWRLLPHKISPIYYRVSYVAVTRIPSLVLRNTWHYVIIRYSYGELLNLSYVAHTMDLLQMDCLRSFFLWSWWSSPPPGCTHINDYIQMTR